jgi:hypothetical protein
MFVDFVFRAGASASFATAITFFARIAKGAFKAFRSLILLRKPFARPAESAKYMPSELINASSVSPSAQKICAPATLASDSLDNFCRVFNVNVNNWQISFILPGWLD